MRDAHIQLEAMDNLDALISKGRTFVWIVSGLFGMVFAFLLLSNIPIATTINSAGSHTLTRIALVIYYNAWVFAQPIEFGMMRRVYIVDPNHGKIPKSLFFVIPALVMIGFLLILFQENEQLLSIVLGLFFIIDVALWQTVRMLAVPMKEASTKIFNEERMYIRLEQLKCYVDDYLRGTWQFYRFPVIAIFLIAVLLVCQLDWLPLYVGKHLHSMMPDVSADKFAQIIPGAAILAYVVYTEASSWRMRLQTRQSIIILGKLRTAYELKPQADFTLHP